MHLADDIAGRLKEALSIAGARQILEERRAAALGTRCTESDKNFVLRICPQARCVRHHTYQDHFVIRDADGVELGDCAKAANNAWGNVAGALFGVARDLDAK